jgi:hypothetical protein
MRWNHLRRLRKHFQLTMIRTMTRSLLSQLCALPHQKGMCFAGRATNQMDCNLSSRVFYAHRTNLRTTHRQQRNRWCLVRAKPAAARARQPDLGSRLVLKCRSPHHPLVWLLLMRVFFFLKYLFSSENRFRYAPFGCG